MREAGHDAVYAYRFDWDGGGRFLLVDFKRLLGASHGFEMPFVFNRFQHLGRADKLLFRRGTEEDRQRLSAAMGAYWASVARDGALLWWSARVACVTWYRETLAELMDLAAAGTIKPVVAERIPLADATRAHELLKRGGHAGKVVLITDA